MVHRWQWRWYRGGKVKDIELGEEEPVWAIQTERVAFRCGGCGGKGIVFGQERWRQEECLGRKGGGRKSVWAGKVMEGVSVWAEE